jgi:hypothetical protein
MAVDRSGVLSVAGETLSTDFPTVNAVDSTFGGGGSDAFVTSVGPDGSFVQSTYLGGDGVDAGRGLAVDGDGNVYAAVRTSSTNAAKAAAPRAACANAVVFDFNVKDHKRPLRTIAFDLPDCIDQIDGIQVVPAPTAADTRIFVCGNTPRPTDDALVVVADGNGALVHETTIGGSDYDRAVSIALDADGGVYVGGVTRSADFHVVDPIQPMFGGGEQDGFVARLRPGTYEVDYATYVGGADYDDVMSIAVDPHGNVLATGSTDSTNFPTTPGALEVAPRGARDAYCLEVGSVLAPDFALATPAPTLTVARRQAGTIAVGVVRLRGFTGEVTLSAPDTRSIKVKLTPASASTRGDSVSFSFKVKKRAVGGSYPLTFTGTDAAGRTRTVTLTMVIQP